MCSWRRVKYQKFPTNGKTEKFFSSAQPTDKDSEGGATQDDESQRFIEYLPRTFCLHPYQLIRETDRVPIQKLQLVFGRMGRLIETRQLRQTATGNQRRIHAAPQRTFLKGNNHVPRSNSF